MFCLGNEKSNKTRVCAPVPGTFEDVTSHCFTDRIKVGLMISLSKQKRKVEQVFAEMQQKGRSDLIHERELACCQLAVKMEERPWSQGCRQFLGAGNNP